VADYIAGPVYPTPGLAPPQFGVILWGVAPLQIHRKKISMTTVLINYGHYLGLAGLFAGLALELALFRPRVDGAIARRLALADTLYGLAAVLVLVTGLLRLFAGDKPASYFGVNFIFHIKLTVFVVVAFMSIWPAMKFFGGRRAVDGVEHTFPSAVGILLRIELALLLLIPLLGTMVARGFGFRG